MKSVVWLGALALALILVTELPAQIPFRYHGGSGGFGFSLKIKTRHGYGSIHINRGGWWGGYSHYPHVHPLYRPPVIYKEVHVHPPRPIVVVPPEPEPEYDITGVDLDKGHTPDRIGPDGRVIKQGDLPAPKVPTGKEVSKPKKVTRPGDPKGEKKEPVKKKSAPKPKPKKGPLADPKEEAERLIGHGVEMFRKKNFGLAAQRFQRAIDTDGKNFWGYFLRAQAEFALGHYPEAAKSIEAGMKLQDDWPKFAPKFAKKAGLPSFNPRLDLYRGHEDVFEKHLKRLHKVVKLNPKSGPFLFVYAHQLWFDSRTDEAKVFFRRARKHTLNPFFIDRFLEPAKVKVVSR